VAKRENAKIYDRTVTPEEQAQVDRANESGKPPIVFVHGLWHLPTSRDRWANSPDTGRWRALISLATARPAVGVEPCA